MAYNWLFDDIGYGYSGIISYPYRGMDNEGIKKLVNIFNTRHVKCSALYLHGNPTGNSGITELSKYLKVNNTIKDLRIFDNRFDIGCIAEFVDMMKYNESIEYLDMSCNKIGDAGIIKLFEALKHNTTLTTLNLRGCGITNDGAGEIIKMLGYNYTLKTVGVGCDQIGSSHIVEIDNMLYMPYKLNKKGWYIYNHHLWDKQMKDIIYTMIMINNIDVNKLVYLPNELMYLIFYFIKI